MMRQASIDHRWARAVTFCLLVAIGGCSPTAEEAPEEPNPIEAPNSRPNLVILLSIDTLRADHLSLYGHHRSTSPVLDAFASEGVVFEDCSSPSPWTAPAHASMLTGLYPRSHGLQTFETPLSAGIPTLAKLLASEGYQTAAVVNSGWLKKERYGITRDFENYLFVDDTQDRRAPNTWITDQAMEWIRDSQGRPLFLFVHYYDVHSDYSSLPEYERLFATPYSGEADGTGWQLARASFEDDYLEMCHENYDPKKCRIGNLENFLAVDRSVGKIVFNEADIRHLEELYDSGIRQLDNEIGCLFRQIEAEGLLDDALIVITSDHGEEFMDHGRMDHFLTMYQEVLRVPLIIRGPGIPHGVRVDTPVSLVDIVPTVLSLTGAVNETKVDGLNVEELFNNPESAAFSNRLIFGEASGGLTYELMMEGIYPIYHSIRQNHHKLIRDQKEESWFLYDLESDPGETTNLLKTATLPTAGVGRELANAMLERNEGFQISPASEDRIVLTPEELQRLRALGYLP